MLFIKIGLKLIWISPSRSPNQINACPGWNDWRKVTASVAFLWDFGASLAIVMLICCGGRWLCLRHIDVHAWEFGYMLVLDQHGLGSWATTRVQVLFGLTSSGLILVPRTLVRGQHLELLFSLYVCMWVTKRCLSRWASNGLRKLGQSLSFKSFGGFANHQRLSAILRCSCYAISDRTLEKISHFGPIPSSDESDKRWTTSWFILHRFTNGMLCNSLRSVWHDRRRYWPLDLVHFLLHVPWRFCSTQRRLHIRLRKYIARPWWFSQPELDHAC